MNFGFTEEQDLLRQEVRKFLDRNCSTDEVRRLMEAPEGFSRDLWKQVGELGWIGLIVPEPFGGAGLGWVDLTVILEEFGRTLFPSPYLATVLAAAAIVGDGSQEQRKRWLPYLAEGSKIGTVALLEASDRLDPEGIALGARREGGTTVLRGEKRFVMDAAAADLFVVAFREAPESQAVSLAVVDREAPGVSAENLPTMDLTKRLGRLVLEDVRVDPEAILGRAGAAWPAVSRLFDFGAAAVTAEAIGAAEGTLALTVDYAKQRQQFGSPIGRFQGVKHPLAEMYADLESFKSLLYYAAWALDESPEEAPRAVSMAKAYASEAFARIGLEGVQLHGGIGYTWEYDAQLYLKRAKWVKPMFGDSDYHYDRIATLGGLRWISA